MKKTVLSFTRPKPVWAKWMFRIAFTITTGATAYIAATNLIPAETKYELTLLLKLIIDPVMLIISNAFGEKLK